MLKKDLCPLFFLNSDGLSKKPPETPQKIQNLLTVKEKPKQMDKTVGVIWDHLSLMTIGQWSGPWFPLGWTSSHYDWLLLLY